MSEMNFSDILETNLDSIEEPGTLPMGHWRFSVISGQLKENTRENGPAAEALFTCSPIDPSDDVNDAELEAFGEELEGARTFHKIAIWEKKDMWNVKRFLNLLGYEAEEGDNLKDSVAKTKNFEFTAYVKHAENDKDPEHPYVNLEDIQAV